MFTLKLCYLFNLFASRLFYLQNFDTKLDLVVVTERRERLIFFPHSPEQGRNGLTMMTGASKRDDTTWRVFGIECIAPYTSILKTSHTEHSGHPSYICLDLIRMNLTSSLVVFHLHRFVLDVFEHWSIERSLVEKVSVLLE